MSHTEAKRCADCGVSLGDEYGWCSTCGEGYCLACGRRHFCTSICPARGCIAGLCVRLVEGGVLSSTWGLPAPIDIARPAPVERPPSKA
jgi:hypothetical protein